MNGIEAVYNKLCDYFGEQRWWPTTTKNKETEVIIGAILTQNTAWKNVEKAIESLKKEKLIDFEKLAAVETTKLALLIKSSGYYNQKAERLKLFARHICDRYNGNVKLLLRKGVAELRDEMLQLKGIGPETADSIILYAANKPVFVVDAYTRRIFSRLGISSEGSSYEELQQMFMKSLPEDTAIFNQYHALIVELGKNVCRKKPRCSTCPLRINCSFSNSNI